MIAGPWVFGIVFCCIFDASAAAPKPEYKLARADESAYHNVVIEDYVSPSGQHQVWFSDKADRSKKSLLFESPSRADVLLSPDLNWAIVDSRNPGHEPKLVLFKKKADLEYEEVRDADIGSKLHSFYAATNEVEPQKGSDGKPCQPQMSVMRWSEDSGALMFVLTSRTAEDGESDPWLCVFNLATMRPSLDFQLMDANSKPVDAASPNLKKK